MHKARTAVLVIGIAAILFWLISNREVITWSAEVPHRFRGSWQIVDDFYTDNYGIRLVHLSENVIVLDMVLDEYERETRRFQVRRVSIRKRKGSEAGRAVIFYGPADKDTIAKHRLEVLYGRKKRIQVYEIVPTGWGEDHWFYVGEFVMLE